MSKKSAPAPSRQVKVSGERAGRLYRLLLAVAKSAAPRTLLIKKLKIGARTFYRDIDLLRECGVAIETQGAAYQLSGQLEEALHLLPFPDPELTFGEVLQIMKGRSSSHDKLRKFFVQVTK